MEKTNDNAKLQEKIIAEWIAFSRTDAYKDWVSTMEDTMQLLQDNVDNLTEKRPTLVEGKMTMTPVPIDSERATNMNQRKVGIRYAMQYPQLRIESAE